MLTKKIAGVSSPRSAAQITTARLNGARSRGPSTPEGKAKSRTNGLVHGFRASVLATLPHESPDEFSAHVGMWIQDLAAETMTEIEVAKSVALLRWRLRRIEDIEVRRQQAEVLRRLEDTPEAKNLELFNNTITAIKTMTRAMASRLPESREELDQLLAPMAAIVKMLLQVEDTGATIFVGAAGLATAIETLKELSNETVHPLAYGEVLDRALLRPTRCGGTSSDVEKMVETVKNQLSMELPLPGDHDVALRTRYKRDVEKRLETEMRFLMQLQERRKQVPASGSLGRPASRLRPVP